MLLPGLGLLFTGGAVVLGGGGAGEDDVPPREDAGGGGDDLGAGGRGLAWWVGCGRRDWVLFGTTLGLTTTAGVVGLVTGFGRLVITGVRCIGGVGDDDPPPVSPLAMTMMSSTTATATHTHTRRHGLIRRLG